MKNGLLVLGLVGAIAGASAESASGTRWGDYVEADFPFYSSVVDGRPLADDGFPADNLTARGLILKPGHDLRVCYDIDLLRVAVIWAGAELTPAGMAPGSYHEAGHKAPPGQQDLPRIRGTAWTANGLYPGWVVGHPSVLTDPREPGLDPKEQSRGPLDLEQGQFHRTRLTRSGVLLEYRIETTEMTESIEARLQNGVPVLQRTFWLGPGRQPLTLALGVPSGNGGGLRFQVHSEPAGAFLERLDTGVVVVRVPATEGALQLRVVLGKNQEPAPWDPEATYPAGTPVSSTRQSDTPLPLRWPEPVITRDRSTSITNGFALDHLALPTENPWRRNVRFADIAFQSNGTAALVTFDGDVWRVDGLNQPDGNWVWRRFASGLHEPLGIAVRKDEIFVHDRNGLWRLIDSSGNGEADIHELFSNRFVQSAETREFAAGLRVAPDDSFILAKGGIQASSRGKHNGTVLKIGADGQTVEVLGWGFREPFIGVHPETGWVTASDQQGNYIPSTPIHWVGDGQYYGFLTGLEARGYEPPPVARPLTWIPHPVNASGVGQVWMSAARMGALNNKLIHLGYYRPEVFVVPWTNPETERHAAVISLTRDLRFAPLQGAMNPVDGHLYITGFQIWGSQADQISGLARIRPSGDPYPLPQAVLATAQGVLLQFDLELDADLALLPSNFVLERWNYRRTPAYGSAHYRLDGSRGQETVFPVRSQLSENKRAVFLVVPDMQPVDQLRVGWTLRARDGTPLINNAYLTVHELLDPDLDTFGFSEIRTDPIVEVSRQQTEAPEISAGEGARLAELMGCVACHSLDGSTLGRVGPTFKGLAGSARHFTDGSTRVADRDYLRESILDPPAQVVRGYDLSDTGMPSYDGVLTSAQIESLVEYLLTLP